MSDLLALIQSDFPGHGLYIIEVYVIDGNGDPFEVYKGFSHELTEAPLQSVMRNAGYLYFFTVIGTHKDVEGELDSYYGLVMTKEYSWLTEPNIPSIISKNQTSIHIKWSEIYALGLGAHVSLGSLFYSVEVAEGQPWSPKTNDVIFVPNSDLGMRTPWISVAGGSNLTSMEIIGLQPATWYHIRLVVTCRGLRRVSNIFHVATLFDIPSKPLQPRLYISPVVDVYGQTGKPRVHLRWTPPESNGSDIILYQVQLLAMDKFGSLALGDSLNKSKGGNVNSSSPPKTKDSHDYSSQPSNVRPRSPTSNMPPNHGERFLIPSFHSKNVSLTNSRPYELPEVHVNSLDKEHIFCKNGKIDSGYSNWKTIHKNLNISCLVACPDEDIAEYRFRVRAKNEHGWSAYSEQLVANHASHPLLFQQESIVPQIQPNKPHSRATARSKTPIDAYTEKISSSISRLGSDGPLQRRQSMLSATGSDSSTQLSGILPNEYLRNHESIFSSDSLT